MGGSDGGDRVKEVRDLEESGPLGGWLLLAGGRGWGERVLGRGPDLSLKCSGCGSAVQLSSISLFP